MLTEKIQAGLGLWIIISPWFLGFSSVSFLTWSNVLVGTAIFLFNIWKIFGQSSDSSIPK